MVNQRNNEEIPDWQRQAWLTEYQTCEHDIDASASHYWTLAGIFIGISTAILAALIFGILSNNDLLQMFIQETATSSTLFAILSVITILGIGIIIILRKLKGWLKRVNFLADLNYERMQEIETQLGMWKSWRVRGIDHWHELPATEKNRLTHYKPTEWWQKVRESPKYERRSRDWHYKWIFYTITSLWVILTGVAFLRIIIAILYL